MAALIKVLTPEQYRAVSEILDEEGLLLICPDIAERIAKELGIPVEDLNEQYIDNYDFGGEPDRFVDLVSSMEHFSMEAIRERFKDE